MILLAFPIFQVVGKMTLKTLQTPNRSCPIFPHVFSRTQKGPVGRLCRSQLETLVKPSHTPSSWWAITAMLQAQTKFRIAQCVWTWLKVDTLCFANLQRGSLYSQLVWMKHTKITMCLLALLSSPRFVWDCVVELSLDTMKAIAKWAETMWAASQILMLNYNTWKLEQVRHGVLMCARKLTKSTRNITPSSLLNPLEMIRQTTTNNFQWFSRIWMSKPLTVSPPAWPPRLSARAAKPTPRPRNCQGGHGFYGSFCKIT